LDFQAIFFNYSVTTLFQLPTQENKTIVDELAIPITATKFAQLNHIIDGRNQTGSISRCMLKFKKYKEHIRKGWSSLFETLIDLTCSNCCSHWRN